jgi:hypothetical protein
MQKQDYKNRGKPVLSLLAKCTQTRFPPGLRPDLVLWLKPLFKVVYKRALLFIIIMPFALGYFYFPTLALPKSFSSIRSLY